MYKLPSQISVGNGIIAEGVKGSPMPSLNEFYYDNASASADFAITNSDAPLRPKPRLGGILKILRLSQLSNSASALARAAGLVIACVSGGFALGAQDASKPTPSRLDMPVTPANSVLVDFDDGAILRVPKTLIDPALVSKNPKQPVKLEQISMVFQFPEMTETVYPSPMEIIFEKQAGRYVPKPDRFPVYVKSLFHSHQLFGVDPATQYASKGPEWRPVTLLGVVEANVREFAKLRNVPAPKITLVKSRYEGLREIQVPIIDKEYHDKAVKAAKEHGGDWEKASGNNYVEQLGRPYELFMHCDDPSSIKCEANVYIKNSHFQYKVIFPPEAIVHADQLIRAINKMIDGWARK